MTGPGGRLDTTAGEAVGLTLAGMRQRQPPPRGADGGRPAAAAPSPPERDAPTRREPKGGFASGGEAASPSLPWPAALSVFVLAVLIRLPQLHLIPRYTDELTLWREALRLGAEGHWPLVFGDTGYNGAWLIYVLGGLHRLSDSLEGPRLLALLLGSSLVLLTALIGVQLRATGAGLLAALLMALSPTAVLVYSHVLHMIQAAALLLLLAWWLALRSLNRSSAAGLVGAAFFLGWAMQTHPLAIAFLPGTLLWLALHPEGRRLLRGRWGLAGLAALILAYSPILIHLAQGMRETGALPLLGAGEELGRHWRRLPPYGPGLLRLLAAQGAAMVGSDAAPTGVASIIAVIGGALLWRLFQDIQGRGLPDFLARVLGIGTLCMPLLMTEYDNTLPGRYAGLFLPLLYLGLAWLIGETLRRVEQAPGLCDPAPRRRLKLEAWRRWSIEAAAACLAVGFPLFLGYRLVATYAEERAAGHSNHPLRRIVALVEADGRPVVLDGRIKRLDGRGSGPSALLMGLLEWRGVEVRRESHPEELRAYLGAISWPVLVVAADSGFREDLGWDPDSGGGASAEPLPGAFSLLDPEARAAALDDTPAWTMALYVPPGAGGSPP